MTEDRQSAYIADRTARRAAWFLNEATRLAVLGIHNQAHCDVGLTAAARDQLLAEMAASS